MEDKESIMPEEKYTLKISKALANVFQKFIEDHPELGYRSVSEFLIELIRAEAKGILGVNPNMKIEKDEEIKKE